MKAVQNSRDALNRLFAIHFRSLPMYLSWACPYRTAGDEAAWKLIEQIVEDHKLYAARIVELIESRHMRIEHGEFPITFTGSHDLDLDFLVRRLTIWQKAAVTALGECYRALGADPAAQSLADECLGAAKGHLESLEELVAGKGKTDLPPSVKLHTAESAGH
jgi:hypothetical protein